LVKSISIIDNKSVSTAFRLLLFIKTMAHVQSEVEQKQLQFQSSEPVGTVWKHYKGELYWIERFVMKECNEEMDACYFSVKNPLPYAWSRPWSEWNELVNYDGELVRRFVKVEIPK
jgi:hypothetical protein